MQQYCIGLRVNMVFRSLSVFSPDGGISIVYRPLCACLSPNRDSGRSQNTESHRERLYHIQRSQHFVRASVCVHELAATVHVLRYFLLNSGLSVNVSLFTIYKVFPCKGELLSIE